MPNESLLLLTLLLAVAVAIVLLIVLLLRKPDAGLGVLREKLQDTLRSEQREGRGELRETLSALTASLTRDAQAARSESGQLQQQHNTALTQRINELTERTDRRLDEFRIAIGEDAARSRREQAEQQQRFAETLGNYLKEQAERNAASMTELRMQVEKQLQAMQTDNAQKLEQMRVTVDEKLQSTLETRLGESFRLVSERLEAVQRGLGEMQQLASGVGDLKRVLVNVKTRGTFGEVQLGALLEQVLTCEQYASNVATVKNAGERVEYAVKLPGAGQGETVWLPIDAKFPQEDYERLLEAQERADSAAMQEAARALEMRIRDEAKKIRTKYVAPPETTDFALLFLPTEGLYAEVIRRPGLFEALQREHRVTLVGPTTLLALLNALQMGFRTLAIEKRSSEVWQTLGAVKTEFGKFGLALDAVKKKLTEASNKIDDAGVRSRAIERKLKQVEALPSEGLALPEQGEERTSDG